MSSIMTNHGEVPYMEPVWEVRDPSDIVELFFRKESILGGGGF
jgi:hypothetical protein